MSNPGQTTVSPVLYVNHALGVGVAKVAGVWRPVVHLYPQKYYYHRPKQIPLCTWQSLVLIKIGTNMYNPLKDVIMQRLRS